jgi:hypothetical protein
MSWSGGKEIDPRGALYLGRGVMFRVLAISRIPYPRWRIHHFIKKKL